MSAKTIDARYSLRLGSFTLDVDLSLPMRGVTGLYGASGSGKTSLLRCIAGLEAATEGQLIVADEVWEQRGAGTFRPTHEREIGYVFQDGRLFSHLDVRKNLEYGMQRKTAGSNPVDVDAIVELLGLRTLLHRRPVDLSGGEVQRVAIARALLRAPRFVLMDEPLASLDRARKDEVLPFLDRLHTEQAVPIIYVSHSIDEICRLCDHLVVMDAGRVLAEGNLASVLSRLDLPLLNGEEAGAVIDAVVQDVDREDDLTRLRFSGGDFLVAGCAGENGQALRLRIRANDISLCEDRPRRSTILNVLPVEVNALGEASGSMQLVRLKAGSDFLLARVSRRSARELKLSPGAKLFAQVKAAAIRNAAPQ